jgi:hypothetical protein
VVPGNGQDRGTQGTQEAGRVGELLLAPSVAEISTRDHELGLEALDQDGRAVLDRRVVPGPVVQVREM